MGPLYIETPYISYQWNSLHLIMLYSGSYHVTSGISEE